MPTPIASSASQAGRIWLLIAVLLIAYGFLIQFRYLVFWWDQGGGSWVQADWLINLGAGPIRRGPLGEAFLLVARATGVPIIDLLMSVQIALATALYGLTAWLVLRAQSPTALLAVFSAAFFVFVVGTWPASGMRKEVLGFIAILLIACPGGGMGRLVLSAAAMVAGALGHEVGVLFFPAWLVALSLLRPDLLSHRPGQLIARLASVLGLLTGVYAARHMFCPMPNPSARRSGRWARSATTSATAPSPG